MRLNDQKNKVLFLTMEYKYKNLLNWDNIESTSRFSINKILKKETSKDKQVFLHLTLDKWIVNMELEDDELFKRLKKLIRKTKIKLTDIEKESLFVLEERSFSIDRHIKDIEVNLKLFKKEKVGVKFTNAKLFLNDKKLTLQHKGDLLITNRRIIIVVSKNGQDTMIPFMFSKIEEYEYKDYGFVFRTKDEDEFVIRIHDQKTLNNTISNIISKRVKNAIKKYKDN